IGMGAGTVAAYARPGDAMRFYEIDPKVIAIATDIDKFTYISGCAAKAHVDWVLGDARLSLQKEQPGLFDVILVDAFTSDAVPAHLLTVEAMRMYLQKLAPDGVVIMHLSNRNLDLERPVAAAAALAGGASLQQFYNPPDRSDLVESPENVIIVARSQQALAPYRADPRWRPAHADGVRAWTDDYTNLFAALIRRMRDRDEIRKATPPSP
ncbi:MAG: putative spermine/spermidine synthase protein, partial [Devosia sp.]|uniref:spermidine synthase n=1 Tax=Devosia sp. TaxID=1871048 RepID=UPI00262F5FE8